MNVPSPCVRNCCLDQEDVCLGCHRHLDEITGWGRSSEHEKLAILARCQSRQNLKENTVKNKLEE